MKLGYAGLLGVTGIAAGIVTATALHAQGGHVPAYAVAEIHVIDQAAYNAYLPKVKAVVEASGARYLARGGKVLSVEGAAPEWVVIFEVPSLEQAQNFFSSQGWKDVVTVRGSSATVREFVVEGVAP